MGECEDALLEFVEKTKRGEGVNDVRNVSRVEGGKPRINPVRPLPVLKDLPPKDYDVFDFQQMIDAEIQKNK